MASVTNQVSPAVKAVAVTPANDTTLTNGPCRALFIGVGGDVNVILDNDTAAVVFKNCYSGQVLPIAVASVQSTSTTATNIVALY